ncbi:MAG: hypothetical protein HKM88_07215 [Halobacteria archaeon]|nr:hypothetical protein [Halobacteria archaeon]
MKNSFIPLLLGSMVLNPPLYAQEAIQIEIDSAPVEIEIQQPAPAQPEQPVPETVKGPEPGEPAAKEVGGVGIAIGLAVAAALAGLAGGGGGGGSAVSHTPP